MVYPITWVDHNKGSDFNQIAALKRSVGVLPLVGVSPNPTLLSHARSPGAGSTDSIRRLIALRRVLKVAHCGAAPGAKSGVYECLVALPM